MIKHPLRPFRFWMTGCVAVVSLAVGGPRSSWAEERGQGGAGSARGAWQASRFGLAETVQRLEHCALAHGLCVFVRWSPNASGVVVPAPGLRLDMASRGDARGGNNAVLVFESLAGGGTPVVMHGDSAAPDLPLSLCVRSRADGRAEVLLPPEPAAYGDELPAEVAMELTELPAVVADALG